MCYTEAGKRYLLSKIQNPTTNTEILKKRASTVLQLRMISNTEALRVDLEACAQAEKILSQHIVTESSKSADAQIAFSGELTKPLNHIPLVLTLFFILKVYVTPFFALLTPVLLLFLPYIIMNASFDMTIPWPSYVKLMKQMVLGIEEGHELGLKHVAQIFYYVFSLGQAIVQPFITAYHTIQVDTAFRHRGQAIQTLYKSGSRLRGHFQSLGIHVPRLPEPPSDERRAVVWYESTPLIKSTLDESIGLMDMYFSLAVDSRWKPVVWVSTETEIIGFYDQAIPESKAVKNSVRLGSHALLTGPNRGGKSSILRGILQSILYAQTLGLTLADEYKGSPFEWIHTHLQATDRPGVTSLFEQDVKEASDILKRAKVNPNGLVLIDELFHSTNPPDAEISANHFLKQLWRLKATSLISTHTFSIVKESPKAVRKLCVFAKDSDSSNQPIRYSYTLQEGTCFVSSVKEILKEAGVLCG